MEFFIEQHKTPKFGFSILKELDNETNYTYFGARYYDSDISIWLSVDPLADHERSWVSPYNYCQWNPIGRIDKDGLIDVLWHPDGSGNLVADRGDNEFTLQNYIWKNTGSTITVNQSRKLIHTMYNGNPISDITGKRIYHRNIKRIAGDHIATMLNPGTAMVHKGQNDFINSEPVQLIMTILSFALPAGSILKTFKLLPYATSGTVTKEALKFFLRDMPALLIALDNVMGGNRNSSTLPGALLEDIGYPNVGAAIDAGFNATGIVKGVTSGFDPVSVGKDMNDFIKSTDKATNSLIPKNENTGYENK
jgi:RHS repeat-associated protein